MKGLSEKSIEEAKLAAKSVAKHAYAPYSNFTVGAALLSKSQKIYSGCNVENASIGATICAERAALGSLVATEGKNEILLAVIYTPTANVTTPCGICRQSLNEFNPDMTVISICDGKEELRVSLAELLPRAFGPRNMMGR